MLKSKHNILIIICARGGSKGVKGKNIRILAGNPLISYTIKQAIQWGKADHVVVSTDSKEIADVAKKYGAEVPFMRPKDLATDSSGKISTLRHALLTCERLYKKKYQTIIDLDSSSPVRTPKDLDHALTQFLKTKAKSLFSVVPAYKSPYFNIVERDRRGNIMLSKKLRYPVLRRQDGPKVYDMNASIYVYKREYISDPATVFPISDRSEIYIMSEWSSIDIDRETDFQYIEFLLKNHLISL